jgi:hypothetical protein
MIVRLLEMAGAELERLPRDGLPASLPLPRYRMPQRCVSRHEILLAIADASRHAISEA